MIVRRGHLVSCLAGLALGMALVGGVALQPERPRRGGNPPEGAQPPVIPGPDGPGAGPMPFDRERALRRLEEKLANLERQRGLVVRIQERLKAGEVFERGDPELLEALRNTNTPQGGGGAPKPDGTATIDERLALRRLMNDVDPKIGQRLDDFNAKHPMATRIMANLLPKPGEILRAHREDRPLFDLYVEQMRGALDVGEAGMAFGEIVKAGKGDTEEGKARRAAVRAAVAKQFDLRRKVQEKDIETLTKKIEDLRARLRESAAGQDEAVDNFVERLARQAKEMRDGRPPRARPGGEGPGPRPGPGGEPR
jgi:hypothetical protein